MSDASKNLFYTVCRITNESLNDTESSGTGFFMNFTLSNGKIVRTIVACKHVIDNFKKLHFHCCLDSGDAKPIDKLMFTMNVESGINDEFIIRHPSLDLAAIIFSYNDKIFLKGSFQPFYLSFDESCIADPKNPDINFIQDILMLGYPEKVYDTINNKPIVRRGVTATPYQIDFDGQPEFLADLNSFHGSSGSPVFIFNDGVYLKGKSICLGVRFLLLGIFTKGWEEFNDAYKPAEYIEDGKSGKLKIKLPNNLGYVLKAPNILELKPYLEEFVANKF